MDPLKTSVPVDRIYNFKHINIVARNCVTFSIGTLRLTGVARNVNDTGIHGIVKMHMVSHEIVNFCESSSCGTSGCRRDVVRNSASSCPCSVRAQRRCCGAGTTHTWKTFFSQQAPPIKDSITYFMFNRHNLDRWEVMHVPCAMSRQIWIAARLSSHHLVAPAPDIQPSIKVYCVDADVA